MSTSDYARQPTSAYIWVWLPGASNPIPAGRVDQEGASLVFRYGEKYLRRSDSIPLYHPELPLTSGPHKPAERVHGCLLDSGPDSWGQRVIIHRRFGTAAVNDQDLTPLTYLLEAGSDRIGGLDFQTSRDIYTPREASSATLQELLEASELVQAGVPLTPALSEALLRGTSIGGARPKALLSDGDRQLIAKFSSTTDVLPVVQGEYVAMRLAKLAGLNVADVTLTECLGKHVLLVERFDRPEGNQRRLMVSALTVLGLGELGGRYASYADLATIIRHRFTGPAVTLRELFARITFNILTSNTDDHARNQAAFWDGRQLTLTPAYDICPQARAGGEAQQVMAIGADGWRYSQVAGCVARAGVYGLTQNDAQEIVDRQVDTICTNWDEVCDAAQLTGTQRSGFRGAQFLNPFALQTSHT